MKKLLLWLFVALGFAQASELSTGVSLGASSGFAGISARYWGEQWGGQVSMLPVVVSDKYNSEPLEFSGLFGAQLLHRNVVQQNPQPDGYWKTQPYQFVGTTLVFEYPSYNHRSVDAVVLGGGFGIETYWENWRLATGVSYNAFGGSSLLYGANMDDLVFFPSLEITLSYRVF